MASLYERLQSKKAARRRVAMPLSDEAVQAYASAERELSKLNLWGTEEEKADAKAKLAAARAELKANTVVITVEALPRPDWDALQRAHPATSDQVAEAKKTNGPMVSVPWNSDTFVAAAWEACQVPDDGDRRMTYEECTELVKGWSQGEQTQLLQALFEVNQTTVSVEALGE